MFNMGYSKPNLEQCRKLGIKGVRYNLVMQELFLKGIQSNQIFERLWTKNGDSEYRHIIEEAKIPALSVCRAIIENDKMFLPNQCYLISQSYDPSNLFGLRGTDGQLIVQNYETFVSSQTFTRELENKKYNIKLENHFHKEHLPYRSDDSLILVQGQLERAFNLVNSEYDTLFGDIYDKETKEIKENYLELYWYMEDIYEHNLRGNDNAEIKLYEYKLNSDVACFYIHCRKRSRDKVLWYPKR